MIATIYVRTTAHDLRDEFKVSIYSTMQTKATPEDTVVWLNRLAQKQGVNASYELATVGEYWAHRAAIKAQTEAAKRAHMETVPAVFDLEPRNL